MFFQKKMLVYSPFLTAPVVSAVKVFSNFDDQMRLAGAVSGTTGKAFEQLTEKAKQLDRETSFTASEVASGMVSLGRMGFSSTEIENSIWAMMNLAKATGTDLASASDIASNTMRAESACERIFPIEKQAQISSMNFAG